MKLIYQTINNDGSINEPVTVELNPELNTIIVHENEVENQMSFGIIKQYKETYKISFATAQTRYITTDKEVHFHYDAAVNHQRKNDGFRKTCKFCNGRGETFIDRRDSWQYDSPDARIPTNLTEWKTCTNCNGCGYIDINDL
jgi:hypothetical protein